MIQYFNISQRGAQLRMRRVLDRNCSINIPGFSFFKRNKMIGQSMNRSSYAFDCCLLLGDESRGSFTSFTQILNIYDLDQVHERNR